MTARATCTFILAALVAAIPARPQPPAVSLAWEETLESTDDHPFRWPVAVAVSGSSEIAVADAWGSRLVVFRNEGGVEGWKPTLTVELPAPPLDVAHDGEGFAVSLRREAGLFAVESPDGRLRRITLPTGALAGHISERQGGGLLVHDLAGQRILLLDRRGRLDHELPVEGPLSALQGAASGGVYAAVADRAEVVLYGPNAQVVERWAVEASGPVPVWPSGLAIDLGGRLLVADRHNGRVLTIDSAGRTVGVGARPGRDEGLLLFPADLALLAGGRLVVADEGNGRIQIYRRLEGE